MLCCGLRAGGGGVFALVSRACVLFLVAIPGNEISLPVYWLLASDDCEQPAA